MTEEHSTRYRVAQYYFALASEIEDRYQHSDFVKASEMFADESGNILSSFRWCYSVRDWNLAGELCSSFPRKACLLIEYLLPIETKRELLDKAITCSRDLGNKIDLAFGLSLKGQLAETDKHYGAAIQAHLKAGKIFRDLGDRYAAGSSYSNIGVILLLDGKPRQAIKYHIDHIRLAREAAKPKFECYGLRNLGIAFRELGKYRTADHCFSRSTSMAKSLGHCSSSLEPSIVRGIGEKAETLRRSGELDKSVVLFWEAINLVGYRPYDCGAWLLWSRLSLVLRQQEKSQDANLANQNSRTILDQIVHDRLLQGFGKQLPARELIGIRLT